MSISDILTPEWMARYIGKVETMKLTLDEKLSIEMYPANFAAGFMEGFNRFRKNDDPPVSDPTSWYSRGEITAWVTGLKYGKIIMGLPDDNHTTTV